MQGHRQRRYGTPVTLMDDPTATEAADALQAAYFRRSLIDERAHLLAEVTKRRDNIAARGERGDTKTTARLGTQLRSVEAQVRYLGRLIAWLDHRFATQLSSARSTRR
jgi:UDP-N-acetylmuramate-alanine ligase